MIIAQLNINSLRNKFGLLVQMLHNNLNIILVSETKIDSSFPIAHFQIEGYTACRQDMPTVEVILFCIKEDIPSKPLNSDVSIKSFYFQINIAERNGFFHFLNGFYYPIKNLISNYLKEKRQKLGQLLLKICQLCSSW